MHCAHQIFAEVAARHSRLIGENHRAESGLVQQGHRLRGPGIELEARGVVDVANLLVQCAVAVEEDGRTVGTVGII